MPHPDWMKVMKEGTTELSPLSTFLSVSLNAPSLEIATGTSPGNVAWFLSGLCRPGLGVRREPGTVQSRHSALRNGPAELPDETSDITAAVQAPRMAFL